MSVWDTCLQITVACTVVGAWVGAFPIPLDWDRPWQVSQHPLIKNCLHCETVKELQVPFASSQGQGRAGGRAGG